MSNLIKDILAGIGESHLKHLTRSQNVSEKYSKKIVERGSELILEGLSKNIQNEKDGDKIIDILKKDHLNSSYNIDFFSEKTGKRDNKILDHIFKNNKKGILKAVANKNEINWEQSESFMEKLSLLIMNGLAKITEKTNMNGDILSRILGMAAEADLKKNDKKNSILSLLDLNNNRKTLHYFLKVVKNIISFLNTK